MKKRKILSLILSLVMVITALPLTAVNSFATDDTVYTSGDWSYRILDDGTVEIYKDVCVAAYSGNETNVTIPSQIDGYTVTSIGDFAFCNCTSLISIIIPDNVTSIGLSAFQNCTSLTRITISDSVTSIGFQAFCSTAYYNNADNWENNALYIGNNLIRANVSGDYNVKEGTKTIAVEAFSRCDLKDVVLPDSIRFIDENAFYFCTISKILIPASIELIEENAFEGCSTSMVIYGEENSVAQKYAQENNIKFLSDTDFIFLEGDYRYKIVSKADKTCEITAYYNNSEYKVSIPSTINGYTVTSIGGRAFSERKFIEDIVIPDTVVSIGDEAFYGCRFLETITIPSSVETIGDNIFDGCISLTCIYGYKNTEAEQYANSHDINFMPLDEAPVIDPNPVPNPDEPTPNTNPDDPMSDPDDSITNPNPDPDDPIIDPDDPILTPEIPADVNGDSKITVIDAKWVLQAVANSRTLTAEQITAADVNGDGKVTVVDAKWILQAVAGMRDLAKK